MRKATLPSRTGPFLSREEVAAYTSAGDIECLECGRRLQTLHMHLRRAHEMTCEDYRQKWAIPAKVALAGTLLRAMHRQTMLRLVRAGAMSKDPSAAARASVGAPRQPQVAWVIRESTERAVAAGRASALPPSKQWNREKRAAYALAHYHLKRGNPQPMCEFRARYGTPERPRRGDTAAPQAASLCS